jgi:hypothetical protein
MPGTRLRIRERDLSWQQLDDEVVILDLAGSTYLKLNGPAAVLWHVILTVADEARLVEALLEEYDIDQVTAERDVEAFLAKLRRANLLETVPTRRTIRRTRPPSDTP